MNTHLMVFALAVLTGCAALHQPSGGDRYWLKPGASVDEAAVSLLHYASYVRGLGSADRDKEVERQRAAFAKDKSDFRRLQYALALATPPAGSPERRQALQLLETMQEGRHDADLAALASLVSAHLHAQRRVDERLEGAEKKLDALKDIERSLLQREKGKP